MLSENYPSTRSVSYHYDTAGRIASFTGNLGLGGSQQNYATSISYTAAGLLTKEQFGTNTALYHRRHYNNRQQLFDIRLGTDSNTINDGANWAVWTQSSRNRGALYFYYNGSEAFGDGGAYNNGNVYRADHVVPLDEGYNDWVDSICYYGYDELNRLSSVDELPAAKWVGNGALGWLPQAYAQRYKYDRYGNRTINTVATWGININRKAFDASTVNNRLSVPAGQIGTLTYDAAGNLTNDTYTGVGARVYDAENRITSAVGTGNPGTNTFVYDGEGKRVRRIVNNTETWQVYGIGGELLAEYSVNGPVGSPQKEYGYRGGQLLLVYDSTESGDKRWQWLVPDQLGTPRMIADLGGSLSGMRRHDYLPFGEELMAGLGVRSTTNGYVGDNVRQKYVGYERDGETGLDYAQARYYSNAQGRFISVDPANAGAITLLPQTWNGYSYALNNPLVFSDPDGKSVKICDNIGNCTEVSDADANRYLFNTKYQQTHGFTVNKGRVYDNNGTQVGTYTNFCCDSLPNWNSAVLNETAEQTRSPLVWAAGVLGGKRYRSATAEARAANRIAKSVTSQHGLFDCKKCAEELLEKLEKHGIKGELIELKARGGYDFIVSATAGNREITRNGMHYAVRVGDTVYDNIHKGGISFDKWVKDFDARLGVDITITGK